MPVVAVDLTPQRNKAPNYWKTVAVTLSDTDDLVNTCDAFMVGVSGNVTLIDAAGNTTLIKNCTQGVVYRIRANRFKTSGTAATDIVALYSA